MLEFLFFISAKKVVVVCAIIGALLVTAAPQFAKYAILFSASQKSDKNYEIVVKALVRFGYGFVSLSVALFIIAGFIVDMR